MVANHFAAYLPAEQVERRIAMMSAGLMGTPEQIIKKLSDANDLGLGYAICYFADAAYDQSSIDLFAKEVIPGLAN